MAESAVGLVLDKLVPLVTEEVKLLRDVNKQIEEIKLELESLRAFLRDADSRAEAEAEAETEAEAHKIHGGGAKLWVQQLRDVAFQIEDMIDDYTLQMVQQRQRQLQRQRCRFLRCFVLVGELGGLVAKLKLRRRIASQIQQIKESIQNIKKRSLTYEFDSIYHTTSVKVMVQSSSNKRNVLAIDTATLDALFPDKDEVLSVKAFKNLYDELFKYMDSETKNLLLISIVGMAGIGKTTLAKLLYDDLTSKSKLECCAWIRVSSQPVPTVDMLRSLMKQFCSGKKEAFPNDIDSMDEDTLIKKIRDYVQNKKYIVVFDDVWQVDFWRDMKHVLFDNEQGGRILITTRNMQVTYYFIKPPHGLYVKLTPSLFSQDEDKEEVGLKQLFCQRAFALGKDKGVCPTNLKDLCGEIVGRCDGLPLVIVTVADYFLSKFDESRHIDSWKKLNDNFRSELEKNSYLVFIKKSLLQSYYELPYYLKSCLLYLGMLPENTNIECKSLIRLWIAEGFAKLSMNKTSEVIAQEYLNQLVEHGVVNVTTINPATRRPKSCRLQNIFREILLGKMEDLSFCRVLSMAATKTITTTTTRYRRLSFAYSSKAYKIISERKNKNIIDESVSTTTNHQYHVRSIFVFDKDEISTSIVSTFVKSCKLLKVLDFVDTPCLNGLPEDIGNLFHLIYLSVKGTKVVELPRSIGKLENLETLDLRKSLVRRLPDEINKLRKLRYLSGYLDQFEENKTLNQVRGLEVAKGIGCLDGLQHLSYVEAQNAREIDLFKELKRLSQLKKLGIKLRKEDGSKLCDCIGVMKQLESLSVASTSEDEMIDLESLTSTPPQFLQRLCLLGRLGKFPKWLTRLENLVQLKIVWSKLEDEDHDQNPLKAIQYLPTLLRLEMYDAYDGKKLQFVEGSFPKLLVLAVGGLRGLELLIINEGALQAVQVLVIGPCPQMNKLPTGIQNLKQLQGLIFEDMADEFVASMKRGSQHYEILKNIADVRFCRKGDTENEVSKLLPSGLKPVNTDENLFLKRRI